MHFTSSFCASFNGTKISSIGFPISIRSSFRAALTPRGESLFKDVSQVQKYSISEDAYDAREKTLRKEIAARKAKDPGFVAFSKDGQAPGAERPKTPENVRELYPIDGRCECNP